jgi:hypothetical protein
MGKKGGPMFRFLFGVIVGVILSFLLVYCGGGKTVKKVGEGLTETGKRMEALEEGFKKESDDLWKGMKKKFTGEGKGDSKKTQ